jgi:hypothetical protein
MKLNFRNSIQVTLFKVELSGQISDGMWENARPHNHFEVWCNANVSVDAENVGRDLPYVRKSNYDFCSKELLNVIGERMVFAMNLRVNNPDLQDAVIDRIYDVNINNLSAKCEWHIKVKSTIEENFGSLENFDQQRRGPLAKKDLVRELQDMKKIINTVQAAK